MKRLAIETAFSEIGVVMNRRDTDFSSA